MAGDSVEPFLARVIDVVSGPASQSIMRLDVVGVLDQMIAEIRHARLLST